MKQTAGWQVAAVVAWVLIFAGCGGAPGGTARPAPMGNGGAAPALGTPARRVPPSTPAPLLQPAPGAAAFQRAAHPATLRNRHGAAVGFALDTSGDLVAFDPGSGRELGRFLFGRNLEDLCWDARTRRVLIVEHDAYADGSRVHAVRWTGSAFVLESSSPVLPGHSRVSAALDRVYAVSEEYGVVWNVLDDDLAPVGQFQPLVRPVSIVQAGAHGLLALDSSALVAGQPADQLLGVSHPGNDWQITQQSYLAPGRPSARMVAGKAGSAYVLHKDPGEGTIELAMIPTASPAVPPDFHVVMTGAGRGELQGAVYDHERGVVVVAISRVPIARLALVPTETGRPTALVSLDAPIRSTLWWPRDLVRDPATGRVLVATVQGLVALSPNGGSGVPTLLRDAAFAAPDLRGPIALGE